MSTGLGEFVQHKAVEVFGADPAALNRLRPALRGLRADYRGRLPPDFSDPDVRAAYVLAYHPHHCVLAAEAFSACGWQLLGIDGADSIRVTVLGAGPAAEVVALAWLLQHSRTVIDATLVDREPGWEHTRQITIDAATAELGVRVRARHVVLDLATAAGRAGAARLVRDADLVVVQALLTELAPSGSSGALVDELLAHFGATTRLVVVDYEHRLAPERVDGRFESHRHSVTLTSARFTFPAPRPIEPLGRHLFANEDGLIPRRKLECSVRVLARPGVRPRTQTPPGLELTAEQSAAIDAFRAFLDRDDRIFVLRGTAGTGKTTMISAMASEAEARSLPVTLLAPTGRGAARLRELTGRPASTIHSQLYRFAEHEDRGDDLPPLSRFVLRSDFTWPSVHIVDEASLVGNRPAAKETTEVEFGEGRLLSDLLTVSLKHPQSRLVIVGDPHQLPPFGEDTRPALDEETLAELSGHRPVCAELSRVVRQDDASGILPLAHAWLEHGHSPPTLTHDPDVGVVVMSSDELEPWLVDELTGARATVVAAINDAVKHWNRWIRRLAGRPDGRLVPGDRLLVVRTDPLHGVFNGDELEVVAADDAPERVRVKGDTVHLRRAELSLMSASGPLVFDAFVVDELLHGAGREDAVEVTRVLLIDFCRRTGLRTSDDGFAAAYRSDERVNALRATFAYARTCHKAQGSEWDRVLVDFAFANDAGRGSWAYTALTRARNAVHLLHVAGRYDNPEALARSAADHLDTADLRVPKWRPIQDGVQLTVARGGDEVAVNLYERKGVPSSVVATGPDCVGLHAVVTGELTRWIQSVRARQWGPLPEPLAQVETSVAEQLARTGSTVGLDRPAQYQVRFSATRDRSRASIVYDHDAAGRLTSERSREAHGDPSLLAELRAAVEAARG